MLARLGLDAAQRVDGEREAVEGLAASPCGFLEVDGVAQARFTQPVELAGQDLCRREDHGRGAFYQGCALPQSWRCTCRGYPETEVLFFVVVGIVEGHVELCFAQDLALDRADPEAFEARQKA